MRANNYRNRVPHVLVSYHSFISVNKVLAIAQGRMYLVFYHPRWSDHAKSLGYTWWSAESEIWIEEVAVAYIVAEFRSI